MGKGILIVAEHQGGKVKKAALELLTKGKELQATAGGDLQAVLIGSGVEGMAAELGKYGAVKVHVIDSPALKDYNSETYTTALTNLIKSVQPQIVLGSSSPLGQDLFPSVAARLSTGVASDCTDLAISNGKLLATRPIYAGKIIAKVKFEGDGPQLATIRPNSFPVKESSGQAQVAKFGADVSSDNLKAKLKEVVKGVSAKVDLTEADIIVAGGRAMKAAENFKLLEDLADAIGGNVAVGASRSAVDAGYVSHDIQVGQTGKVVNPTLYIACGISGAIQHLAGMQTSKVIVAINKDPEAPIFQKADYGIIGDLFEVLPLLTQEFKKLAA